MGSLPQLPAEMLASQLKNGLVLLLLGMCTVFIFLTILVVVIKLLSRCIGKFMTKPRGGVVDIHVNETGKKAPEVPVASTPVPAVLTELGPVEVKAPMPGLILRTEAKVGDMVKKNQLLLVMEAMKMENEIYAPCDGVISEIKVSQGQQMNADDVLLIVKGSAFAGSSASGTASASGAAGAKKPAGPATSAGSVQVAVTGSAHGFLHIQNNLGLRGIAPIQSTLVVGTGAVSRPVAAYSGLAAPAPVASVAAPVAAAPAAAPVAAAPSAAPAGGTTVRAPMPGLILRMEVKEGDAVKRNQCLLVMEAMKMENEIFSPCDGTVARICVSQGQQLNADDALVVIG